MAEIDNKVVSITFDNALFERKMAETIASLDKLRNSIDMAGAKQGLTQLAEAGNKFNLDPMSTSIDGASAKFLALATTGITVLTQLVSSAVTAGAQFAKSLTLDPVMQGFGEFELKMGSIQTIMAGSGESLAVVNQKLQELNAYSDRTIYSFADMTSNIGKFTNAGVSLDASVGAIQGVANVAALAGANSEEASRAMYNFAQALSTGSVKLIDWKSIELANMGTVEFKQQIIDTAVAMGTLNKASDGTLTTLKGTTVTTQNFASTLSDAWFTSDVLTSTLNKFSDETTDIGKRAAEAATRIKTFSQMIGTMKESVGSGWAMTFEHIFGNFEEGTNLWTGIMKGFDNVVGKSAEARNKMLADWKFFGGRTILLDGLKSGLEGIKSILAPIGEAFRDIFPKKTATDLMNLTLRFREFAESIKIGEGTAEKIKVAFRGFFAVLSIGWEIIKNVVELFFALAGGIWKVVGPLVGLVSGTGELATGLHAVLVKGEGIDKFFDAIISVLDNVFTAIGGAVQGFVDLVVGLDLVGKAAAALKAPIEMVGKAIGAIKDFFGSLKLGDKAGEGVEETGKAVEKTAGLVDRFFAALANVFGQIGDLLGNMFSAIGGAFKGLGGAIADALGSGDLNQVLNILKTGLLGGILIYIRKFFKQGFKLDLGQGALFDKIGTMLDTVTAGLKSLQANVRADTLLKIAMAMGILTIAIIALSLVDAEALAKAMAAIAAGFAQLTAVMLLLEKASMGGGSIKIVAMASGMVLLAAAMALLVIPIKILAGMSWGELIKGLAGVTVGMLAMAVAIRLMGSDISGTIRAGLAMMLIAGALILLARAIKAFAAMNLTEMAFGLAQAALGIGLLILALKHMPDDVAAKGLGLLILAFALKSLARVVELFAGISFGVLAKGFISISAGLFLIGKAMDQFPDDMVAKSLGLIAISAAMYIMGKAIEQVGNLPFGDLIKGVAGLSVMLGVLAMAIVVMDEAKSGVVGLIAAAAGLLIIGKAIEIVGNIPFGELIKGILGLAAVLAVLAIASVVAGPILLLGVALAAVGAAMILFGAGIALAGKGLELLAKYGAAGMTHLTEALQEFIRQLPQFVSAFVEGLIQAAVEVADQFPQLIESIEKVLVAVLQAIINVIPKVREAIGEMLAAGLAVITENIPAFVGIGFEIIMSLMRGIRDNIGEFVTAAVEIVTNFLDALAEQMPNLVASATNFLATAFQEIAFGMGQLMPTLMIGVGRSFLEGFWTGLTQQLGALGELIRTIISDIIGWFTSGFGIMSPSTVMIDIGKNIIQGLLNGLGALLGLVKTFFVDLPKKVLGWLGNVVTLLLQKGKDFISGLLRGLVEKIVDVTNFYTGLAARILGWIGNVANTLMQKGRDLIAGLWNGISERIISVTSWLQGLGSKVVGWVGNMSTRLLEAGRDLIRGLWGGINAMKDWVMDKVKGFAGGIIDGIKGIFRIGSPSKVFRDIGANLGESLGMGLKDMGRSASLAAAKLGDKVHEGWERAKVALTAKDIDIGEIRPTITPVLDLSELQRGASGIGALLGTPLITPEVSTSQARHIATSEEIAKTGDEPAPYTGPTEVTFEQNIYAPTALSVNDIYRNTKSQIALAKEELSIR